MNKNLRFLFLLVVGCWLLAGLVSALPIYVSPLSGGELQASTSFDYVFNFTSSVDCSGMASFEELNIEESVYGLVSILGL